MANPRANENLVTAKLVVMPNIARCEIVLASRPSVRRVQRDGEVRLTPHIHIRSK